ncbi:MAG: hypothetical protein AB1894_13890 [Chloroflexota bacterium]
MSLRQAASGYKERIENALGASFLGKALKLSFDFNSLDEAKLLQKRLILMQKQLRAIKKDAQEVITSIRADYRNKKESVANGGQLTSLLFGKKAAGRDRQKQRHALDQKQKSDILPYENVVGTIDGILLEIDKAKLRVETYSKRINDSNSYSYQEKTLVAWPVIT